MSPTSSPDEPPPILHHHPPVGRDPAAVPEVDDQVPGQGRLVRPAGPGVALAEGEMPGAADLLIKEDAAGESLDAVIQAQAQLAEPTRAGVQVEHRQEVRLPLVGPRRDDPAAVELQVDRGDLTT